MAPEEDEAGTAPAPLVLRPGEGSDGVVSSPRYCAMCAIGPVECSRVSMLINVVGLVLLPVSMVRLSPESLLRNPSVESKLISSRERAGLPDDSLMTAWEGEAGPTGVLAARVPLCGASLLPWVALCWLAESYVLLAGIADA